VNDVLRASGVLDFLTERDDRTHSWTRGHPDAALIAPINRFGWDVTLPGGDTHRVVLAMEGRRHVGRCDCKHYVRRKQPCAHLCALYRAHTDDVTDADGNAVTLPVVPRLVDGRDVRERSAPEQLAGPEPKRAAIPDGGREIVGGGHDEREFGRPEGLL
jgi:hypothetical protein